MKRVAVVATTSKPSEATVIRSLLESYDIPTESQWPIPQLIYPLAVEGITEIRILVPVELEDEALRILRAHRRPDSPLRPV